MSGCWAAEPPEFKGAPRNAASPPPGANPALALGDADDEEDDEVDEEEDEEEEDEEEEEDGKDSEDDEEEEGRGAAAREGASA